ncbi:MAG: hypothetical protein COA62_01590 [Rhodobiaceae bacterium]|nr:MAG: hypothetical protein COA62_01590 [Rhodobiaceae bacterium]
MMKKIGYGLVGLVLVAAVGALTLYMNPKLAERLILKPSDGFDLASVPPAPDYASPDAWAALPDRQDNADVVPPESGAKDNQATALVDVFFVHPTTYYQSDMWNARYDEPGVTTEFLEDGVLRHQAAVFNGSAKVYAPRYRQATLYSFMGDEPDTYAALAFAYEDVERAFDHFINNMNTGRPFILASHSQGSLHAMKLLEEKIAGTPLANRMVAAYIVGYSIPEELGADGISPCADEYSTGCYLNWNSLTSDAKTTGWKQTTKIWINGRLEPIAGRKITCVNPIVGILGASAAQSENIGGQPFADAEESIRPVVPGLTEATCTDGMLIVSPPTDDDGLTFGVNGGDYHIYDYNLFHMNLRADIARRIGAFWKL